jgi:hypothetical protein
MKAMFEGLDPDTQLLGTHLHAQAQAVVCPLDGAQPAVNDTQVPRTSSGCCWRLRIAPDAGPQPPSQRLVAMACHAGVYNP